MTIIDANLLLYAYNADAPQQKASAQWLQELLKSGGIIGLPWVTLWAFIRISTNSRIWANPRSAREAFAIVGEWLRQPGVVPLHPGPLHAEILEKLVSDHGATGPLVTDAVLAALAMEHGAFGINRPGLPPLSGATVAEPTRDLALRAGLSLRRHVTWPKNCLTRWMK